MYFNNQTDNSNYGSEQYGGRPNRPARSYGQNGHNQGGGGSYGNGGNRGGRIESENTLWMGNIDENMDEQFIESAFQSFGSTVQNVKIIRNRDTGVPVGYGFITFADDSTTQTALRELNGKLMPNTEKTFFLKSANRPQQQQQQGGGGGRGPQMSIHVGSLSPTTDDGILMDEFKSLYPSVISAKVIMSGGESKGFGFVAFGDDKDFQAALANTNMMIGDTQVTISRARGQTGGGGKNARYQNQPGDYGGYKRKRTADYADQY